MGCTVKQTDYEKFTCQIEGLSSVRTLASFGTLEFWTDFHFRKVTFQISEEHQCEGKETRQQNIGLKVPAKDVETQT